MSTTLQTTIVGVFANQTAAQDAIRELKRNGVSDDQIGVVSQSTHGRVSNDPESVDGGTLSAEGAAVGAATGAGVGALWALGIAAGVLPVIGPIIAGGVLSAVIASAAGGAATAGLAGALIGLGLSEEDARVYEGEVKSGRTLVTVHNADRAVNVSDILRNHGGSIR